MLGPRATCRGDVVRLLIEAVTPEEVRDMAVTALKEQIEEVVTNAQVEPQTLGKCVMEFAAHADGFLVMPAGNAVRASNFGVGRTEKAARNDLHWNLLEQYAEFLDGGESE